MISIMSSTKMDSAGMPSILLRRCSWDLTKVGVAANGTGFSFDVFKDDQHHVFDKGGFSWNVIYYAQAV